MQEFESDDWFKPYEEEESGPEEENEEGPEGPLEEKPRKKEPEKKGSRGKRIGVGKGGRVKKALPVLPWIFAAAFSAAVLANSVRISAEEAAPLKESISCLKTESEAASSLGEALSPLGEQFSNLSASPSQNFVENILSAFSLKESMKADLAAASGIEASKMKSALAEARAVLKGAPPGASSSELSSLVSQAGSESFASSLPALKKEASLLASIASLTGQVALQRAVGGRGK